MIDKWSAVLLFLVCASLTPAQMAGQSPSAVPASRLAHIRHGINLSEWLAQVYDPKGYTEEHFERWTPRSDFAWIRSPECDPVRPSANPQLMVEAARRRNGSAEYFGYLDAAV